MKKTFFLQIMKRYILLLATLFLISSCGGGNGTDEQSPESNQRVSLEIVSQNLVVSNGVDYVDVESNGSFEIEHKSNVFTVYDKSTSKPVYFSYATGDEVSIDGKSTALYLATRYFPLMKYSDSDLLARYNETIVGSVELKLLADKIDSSIQNTGAIDFGQIAEELKAATETFKSDYEEGLLSENVNSEKVYLARLKGTDTYPVFRGMRIETADYVKNDDGTYEVDLTIRNGNPAYLGMTIGQAKYAGGKYSYVTEYNDEYHLIEPGNTSEFYKTFTTYDGLIQSAKDFGTAVDLIQNYGFIDGASHATPGYSTNKIEGLKLSCDRNAVIFDAHDRKTILVNMIDMVMDTWQVSSKLIPSVKSFRDDVSIEYNDSAFVARLAGNILVNDDFILNGVIYLESLDLKGMVQNYLFTKEFFDVFMKELVNTAVEEYGLSENDEKLFAAILFSMYDVSVDNAINPSEDTHLSIISDGLQILLEAGVDHAYEVGFDKAYNAVLDLSGVSSVIDTTILASDAITLMYFMSLGYESFIHPLNFIECGESSAEPKVTDLSPKLHPHSSPLDIRLTGFDLNYISTLSLDGCDGDFSLQLDDDYKLASSISACQPLAESDSVNVSMTTLNGDVVDIGSIELYSSDELSVDYIDTNPSPSLNNTTLFVYGKNLGDAQVEVQDCEQLVFETIDQAKAIYSCTNFSSAGIKAVTILDDSGTTMFSSGIAIGQLTEPMVFSTSINSVPSGETSTIIVFGDNFLEDGTPTISYEILGCNTFDANLKNSYLKFNCLPDTTAGKVTVNIYQEDFIGGEFIKSVYIDIVGVIDVEVPLAILTTQLPNGSSCVDYNHQLAATGGVPPYSWELQTKAGGGAGDGVRERETIPSYVDPEEYFFDRAVSLSGVISGYPGHYAWGAEHTFSVSVEDSEGSFVSENLLLTIDDSGLDCSDFIHIPEEEAESCASVPRRSEGRKIVYKSPAADGNYMIQEIEVLTSSSEKEVVEILVKYEKPIYEDPDFYEKHVHETDIYSKEDYLYYKDTKVTRYGITSGDEITGSTSYTLPRTPDRKKPADEFCLGQAWYNDFSDNSVRHFDLLSGYSKVTSVDEVIYVPAGNFETIKVETSEHSSPTSKNTITWIDKKSGEIIKEDFFVNDSWHNSYELHSIN